MTCFVRETQRQRAILLDVAGRLVNLSGVKRLRHTNKEIPTGRKHCDTHLPAVGNT